MRKGTVMKVLIVLSLEVPEPEEVATALLHIDPPSIPGFSGQARIVVDPHATTVEEWLDSD